jgi:hypothetical protein
MKAALAAALACLAGCRDPKFPAVVGDTQISISSVTIVPAEGAASDVAYKIVYPNLGLRPGSLLYPERKWNEYRLREDRRRLAAFVMEAGHYDATVDEPKLDRAADHVAVTWTVHEGRAYRLAAVNLVGAPPELEAELRELVPFHPGDRMDMENWRPIRQVLADRLQHDGYGHARGYSRVFVDRDAKTVSWFYYLDPGPKTRVGAITVEGNREVPADEILARAHLGVGDPFSLAAAKRVELSLLDTGAFSSVDVVSDAEIQRTPEWPEFGGALRPDQISADGQLVPRTLPADVAVRVVVVEAPARKLRMEAGVEGDPSRVDAFAGTRVVLRNAFGPEHHLVLEGNVGYGWLLDDSQLAGGVYGSALARYVHPIGPVDLRVTTRWRDVLYPAALLRELEAGPGIHATLAPGVFVEADGYLRFARQLDTPMLDPATTGDLRLPADRDASGVDVEASVVADHRDDRVEPTSGWYLAGTTSYSPGGALADHRWLGLGGDARWIGAVSGPWSVALRASGSWVVLPGDSGVPLGPRLFGGGAYGMRGFGRDQLSPSACAITASTMCDRVLVGGRSLVESSAELRFLPWRKQFGFASFVDVGGAGAATNPFEDGVSVAAGVGARLRLWYVPLSLDVAYRIVDRDDVDAAWDRILAFVRVGEAF